jgi:hypothetical protein
LKALNVVIAHARPMWEAATGEDAGDEDLRSLFRALRVVTIDANDGEPQRSATLATLATVLAPADADAAWPVLVEQGQAASVSREWRDRASIGTELARRGIYLAPPGRFGRDIQTLRELSVANLAAFATDAVLPMPDALRIPREASAVLASGAGDGNVLIVGDAGAGKSAVAQGFAAARAADQQVVALRATDIAGANKVPLADPLAMVLREWTGPPAVLMIDGVDALRGAEDRHFLTDVVTGLRGSRWQVVATARTFDARNNHDLQAAFAGHPLSAGDLRLAGVRHLLIGDLTDAEIDAVVVPPLALASLLAKASPELRSLLRNPFNLRLAAVLTATLPAAEQDELLAVRSRVDLLEAYWDHRIRAEDRTAREAILARLCKHMAAERSLRVIEAEPLVTASDSAAMQALLSENVLEADAGIVPTGRRVLAFSHNILFDYAAAIYVLLDPIDPGRLRTTLDRDPALPLVIRPSFDLLVDMLWEHRAVGAFWPLCLDLAASPHVLASLAFAARLLRLVRDRDDLLELAPAAGATGVPAGRSSAQEFSRELVGALRAPAVLPDATVVAVPLAALALRFAQNATGSYANAALAADILIGLQLRLPLDAGRPGADDRCLAIAALLDACRFDPPRMEALAGAAARQLPHAVKAGEPPRAALGRLLDDDGAMREWGGTVLMWLAEAVEGLISVDPALARRAARSVWTFEETRDDQVTFGGGPLLPLNESRKQQAQAGAYRLGEAFARMCATDLESSIEIFCDLADDEQYQGDRSKWPLLAGGASGGLRYGRDLSMIGFGAGDKAAAAVATALAGAESAGGDTTPAVAILVGRLGNATAWAELMSSPSDAPALGRALLPALDSGALLAHPDTHAAAAELFAALAGAADADPALAARLEAAVLRAHELIDANGGHPRRKDALLGCLRPASVASQELVQRLREFGPAGPPAIVPRMRPSASFTSWSIIDRLADQGLVLPPPVEAAVLTLSDELDAKRNGQETRARDDNRLAAAFAAADTALGTYPEMHPRLAMLLVDSAATLAHDPRVVPGTSLGDRVATLLLAAAGSDDVGELAR